jgi:hypothetical protein
MTFTGAYILEPTTITDAMLTSSTVSEPDTGEVAWASGTFALGDRRYLASNHKVYECILEGASSTSPATDTDRWAEVGPTNKWAMFDASAGTVTTESGPLTVVLRPGQLGALYADDLVGRSLTVTVKDAPGGTVVYSRTVGLDDTRIESVYDWFFAPFVQKTSVALVDLPSQYFDPEVTVTIDGTSTTGCGKLDVGMVYSIGGTLRGASVSIIDYSRKETNDYGTTTIVERGFSKQLRCTVVTERSNFAKVNGLLTRLRARPAVYIASTQNGLEPLIVRGFPDDWSIEMSSFSVIQANLSVQGISQ